MARGKEKAVVGKNTLPPVALLSDGTYGYIIRHRIISEDQNRYSQWSPIREIAGQAFEDVDGDIIVSSNSTTVVWDDSLDRPSYDVFVSFDGADYFYHGTSPIHTYTFLNKTHTTVDVAIQIESINKQRAAVLTIATMNATIGS
jgi:enterochelin esterase-like enzyme